MTKNAMTSNASHKSIYRKRARFYDIAANLFYLIGFREKHYREQAVKMLAVKSGSTVVELGCGTGLNFSLLQRAVGPEGKIIGVDMSEAMLAQAQKRINKHRWQNVELVTTDAALYVIPSGADGVLMTFALKAMPDYATIIDHCADVLVNNKRFVILELRQPAWCPRWLRNSAIRCLSAFGANQENANHQPWLHMQRHFMTTERRFFYFGVVYIGHGVSNR